LNRGQQQGDQNTDDRDNNEEFQKRKSAAR
jgi:hypothetical protein